MSTAAKLAPAVVEAAGGVLFRETTSGAEVLLVHKRRGDWTLPKGKLTDHESFQGAAKREVREETGYETEPGQYLGAMGYEADGQPKVVLFWRMAALDQHEIIDTKEVQGIAWFPIWRAVEKLSHDSERTFLTKLADSTFLHSGVNTPSDAQWPKRRLLSFAQARRSYARAFSELTAFRVDLRRLEESSSSADRSWARAAWRHVANADRFLKDKEIDGAWDAFHAARRAAIYGRDDTEVIRQAEILREETRKIPGWRGDAMKGLLDRQNVDASTVVDAMAVRDQHFTNKYYEIWLMGDQLILLLIICLFAVIGFWYCVLLTPGRPIDPSRAWGPHNIAAVLLVGLLGAAFSTAHSLTSSTTIPQRMANHSVTIMRTIFGTVAGLAGYAFWQSKIVSIGTGSFGTGDGLAMSIAIAFVFGYAGDRLVNRVIGSLKTESKTETEGRSGRRQKDTMNAGIHSSKKTE